MKVTREQAIKIINRATGRDEYDDWWMDLMDDFDLYDEDTDTAATLADVLAGLGVSEEEYEKVTGEAA